MKHLVFYSGVTDGAGKRLQDILKEAAPNEETIICRTIHNLAYKLLQLRMIRDSDRVVHILVATSNEELFDLYSIRDLFSGLSIILIAPNRDKETIAKALELYPRFLSFLDDDFIEVAAVFKKMAERKQLTNETSV